MGWFGSDWSGIRAWGRRGEGDYEMRGAAQRQLQMANGRSQMADGVEDPAAGGLCVPFLSFVLNSRCV
jgi:hypothetical protein